MHVWLIEAGQDLRRQHALRHDKQITVLEPGVGIQQLTVAAQTARIPGPEPADELAQFRMVGERAPDPLALARCFEQRQQPAFLEPEMGCQFGVEVVQDAGHELAHGLAISEVEALHAPGYDQCGVMLA